MKRSSLITISLALAAAVLLLYGGTIRHEFINFDDDTYVSDNAHVLSGLSREGLAWAFTTTTESNWHPLTWLSHMLDAELYGAGPGGPHATSVLLHAANAVLLFLVLFSMTAKPWPAAFAAALFAVHPLRVESVAWVAERKDVLSGLFFLLVLLAYARYARGPSPGRYAWVFVALLLGLLAKPMLVTLPLVLLLLDFWPLGRFRRPGALLLEKVPLILLAALSSAVTFLVQRASAASSFEAVPLAARLANAALAYVAYLKKTVLPLDLAIFYPHPAFLSRPVPIVPAVACFILLALFTLLALSSARRRPWLTVGWLFYLGTLVPVIGLVQVGRQSMADRYTYLPLIGIYLALAWEAEHFVARRPRLRRRVVLAAASIVAALMVTTFVQVGFWKDGPTLYRHALDVTRDNYLVHNNLGVALAERGRLEDAAAEYVEALRIEPDYPEAHNNLGTILKKQGRLEEAQAHFEKTIRLRPDFEEAHVNLGNVFEARGDLVRARKQYEAALRIRPGQVGALTGLGTALARQGDLAGARARLEEALRVDPGRVETHKNLGIVLMLEGRLKESVEAYREAVRMRPDDADLRSDLGILLVRAGRVAEGRSELERALALRPGHAGARAALAELGSFPGAKGQPPGE